MAEIGYWIGEPYWNKGIATVVLRMMTEQGYHSECIKKLYAPVLEPNKASMRVLEKCGFQLEGILANEESKDDRYIDVYYYEFFHFE